MATLRDAEQAREQVAEELRLLGAHAVSVEEVPDEAPAPAGGPVAGEAGDHGEASPESLGRPAGKVPAPRHPPRRRPAYAVVAWFAGELPTTLPDHLEVRNGVRTKTVPLRARREERFRAE